MDSLIGVFGVWVGFVERVGEASKVRGVFGNIVKVRFEKYMGCRVSTQV